MEVSPLTQQYRPTSFQPKVAHLYDVLFRQDEDDLTNSDGFWRELFLLRPDKSRLEQQLKAFSTDDLLALQHETQQLFSRAVQQIKTGTPTTIENALDVRHLRGSCAPN